MQISVIVAHPNFHSFNHAIAKTAVDHLARNGHKVVFHDLYAEKFDPVLLADEISEEAHLSQAIKLHCNEISQAQVLLLYILTGGVSLRQFLRDGLIECFVSVLHIVL